MEGFNYTLALGLWLGMLVIAVSNGYLANAYVTPRMGDYGTHVYKTLTFIPFIFVFAWLYAWQTRSDLWLTSALFVSCFWVGLTVLFEFVFGHYVLGNSWEVLLADYRIWQGRLWSLVLISEATAPVITAWIINQL
jgi:hypothetical protein